MKIVRISGIPGNEMFEPSTIALGNFDGVHNGHRQIVEEARVLAEADGVKLAVMTFEPHPRQVLGAGGNYNQQLTPLSVKLQIFKSLGVDICYVVNFDKEFAAISATSFVTDFLARMNARSIVVGFDYRFGAGGRADVSVLRELAGRHGMNVRVVPAVTQYGEKISSSVIREKLFLGEVKLAAELLGSPYEIAGKVVAGEGRGRLLGFPTANIEPMYDYVYPRTGVYVIRCKIEGTDYPINGLMNIGFKPTFHEQEHQLTLEAHLFDFSADLYGQQVQISFLDFLRSEKKFNSVQELIEQITSDADEARRRLQNGL